MPRRTAQRSDPSQNATKSITGPATIAAEGIGSFNRVDPTRIGAAHRIDPSRYPGLVRLIKLVSRVEDDPDGRWAHGLDRRERHAETHQRPEIFRPWQHFQEPAGQNPLTAGRDAGSTCLHDSRLAALFRRAANNPAARVPLPVRADTKCTS
jgi:hypothetical protein